jgi:serine/threonine-protein kinase
MDAERWKLVGSIFDRVVDAAPQDRPALLDELCADDASLRRDVQQLIAADVSAHSFDSVVDSARGVAAAEWASGVDEKTWQHERIGPWRVLSELGRGGMGIVLLAERADGQFEQRAAVKLVKRGMDSDAVQARFLRERQILARLEHPHIARLLDGGISEDGRPYFAMEYIDGEPVLRYCAHCELRLEARIKLFCDVCAAVQFAHGQLVVHRDIKPSNILVTANGEAKLLDFGIAKLLDDSHGGMTQTVDTQHRPLTPAYAAPEQIRGQPVSTATDIYSLGVVLFELLTGKRPFDLRDESNVDDVRHAMDSTTTAPLASDAADDTGPAIPRRLRGDLDTIILTAMRRDPQRRYATVDAFAKDLQRFLAGQPISARRDSVGYRMGKFVDRHRVGVVSAMLGVVVLIAALVFALWQAHEKSRQALVSQQVTTFLESIFRGADPAVSRGANVTAQDLLDQGTDRLHSDVFVEPDVRARLLHTIATTYTDLGLYDRALPLAEESLALRRARSPRNDKEIAESLDDVGRVYRLKGDYAHAEPMLREALELRRSILPPDDPDLIDSLDHLATLQRSRGDFQAASGNFLAALNLAVQRFGKDAKETARYVDDYAADVDDLGKRQDALALYQRALDIRERTLGPDDADVATTLINLGTHLDESGHYAEARPMLERALKIRRQVYGPAHPLVGFAELALSSVYDSQNEFDEAEKLAQDSLAIFRRGLPADHPKISEALNMIAVLRAARRDFSGAVPMMREVVERFQRTLGDDHPDTLTAQNNLAYALLHSGHPAEAEALFRSSLDHARKDNGQMLRVTARENLASALAMQNRTAEAVQFAEAAVAQIRDDEGEVSSNVAVALRLLGEVQELNGDFANAEKSFRAALTIGEAMTKKGSSVMYEWRIPLADFLVGRRRCEEAMPLLDAAIEQIDTTKSVDPRVRPAAQLLRAACLGDRAEAAKLAADASASCAFARRAERSLSDNGRYFSVERRRGGHERQLKRWSLFTCCLRRPYSNPLAKIRSLTKTGLSTRPIDSLPAPVAAYPAARK